MENQSNEAPNKKKSFGKIIFLAAAVLIAFLVFRGQQKMVPLPDIWNRNADAVLLQAPKENRPVVLYFMSDPQNSTTVRMIKQSLIHSGIVTEQIKKLNYLPAFVIVDRKLKDEASKKYELTELPTIMVLSPKGKILDRKTGFTGHADVTTMLVTYAKDK